MEYSVGVDIGGTKIAIAVVNQKGEMIDQTVIPTDLSISPEAMISKINDEIRNKEMGK